VSQLHGVDRILLAHRAGKALVLFGPCDSFRCLELWLKLMLLEGQLISQVGLSTLEVALGMRLELGRPSVCPGHAARRHLQQESCTLCLELLQLGHHLRIGFDSHVDALFSCIVHDVLLHDLLLRGTHHISLELALWLHVLFLAEVKPLQSIPSGLGLLLALQQVDVLLAHLFLVVNRIQVVQFAHGVLRH